MSTWNPLRIQISHVKWSKRLNKVWNLDSVFLLLLIEVSKLKEYVWIRWKLLRMSYWEMAKEVGISWHTFQVIWMIPAYIGSILHMNKTGKTSKLDKRSKKVPSIISIQPKINISASNEWNVRRILYKGIAAKCHR